MTKNEAKRRLVNQEPGAHLGIVCCSLCEKHHIQAAALVLWVSPNGRLVCVHGTCSECAETVKKAPRAIQTKLADRIEQQLLARFPQLFNHLPAGYTPTGKDS